MRTFSSRRSYGRLATIILFLLGMPSSGGPRCLRGWVALVLPVLVASTVMPSSPTAPERASLVVVVRPAAWPGTLVGPVPLVSASPLAPFFACHHQCLSNISCASLDLRVHHGQHDRHDRGHGHAWSCDDSFLLRPQLLQQQARACERAAPKPCDRGLSSSRSLT